MDFKWTKKDLLSLYDLSAEEILCILDTAAEFKKVSQRKIKKVPALRGKTVVNLFIEPSTRTRTSFELAEQRLSADIININADSSSLRKGETLLDTVKNIEGRPQQHVGTAETRRQCDACGSFHADSDNV